MNEPPPLYLQIAQELRRDIADGVYKPGERLPPLQKLAAEYGTSTHPVRRAISLLLLKDLVVTIHGDGTYVRLPKDA